MKRLAPLVCVMLIAGAFLVRAQTTEADRKLSEEIKAKAEKGDVAAKEPYNAPPETRPFSAVDSVVPPLRPPDLVDRVFPPHSEVREKAEKGDPQSQFDVGVLYEFLSNDKAEAVKWFRKAAGQNHTEAQYTLGDCYLFGRLGTEKNEVEAVKWYRKAAEQDHAKAQYILGLCYAEGQGVSINDVEAVGWYRKAAGQNHAEAQYSLGVCYTFGRGVAKDEAEAVKWYRTAAEQNYADAQYRLGACYCFGLRVAKDYVESYYWTLLAAAQGNQKAKELIPVLENLMTREQIAEGQKLARNFKPREVPTAESDSSGIAIAQTRPASSGTGFFITDDGFLVTNEHVVKDATQVRLITSAGLIFARVVKTDSASDVALLKAEGKFAALPVAASRSVKLGGTVATVSFPNIGLQGFAPKLAKGEIASLSGAADDARYFQISVPVQPGNSGGALVDGLGNVVGVVSAKLDARTALAASSTLPENVNYAIKSSYLLSFLESLPAVSSKLKEPGRTDLKFEDAVKAAEQAAVLVLVY
ncbi:MAG: SEL1-like repeat protein [Verrucomicrobia bacterium]|nr:SEL1-like repeat protein [Verrucomicrobiota bacterium]